jgi:hypothetical protein
MRIARKGNPLEAALPQTCGGIKSKALKPERQKKPRSKNQNENQNKNQSDNCNVNCGRRTPLRRQSNVLCL